MPLCVRRCLWTGLALALEAGGPASAADGQGLYEERCAECHGTHGQDKALGQSKILNRLDTAGIDAKLRANQKSPASPAMKDKMKSGLADDEIQALIDHIGKFTR